MNLNLVFGIKIEYIQNWFIKNKRRCKFTSQITTFYLYYYIFIYWNGPFWLNGSLFGNHCRTSDDLWHMTSLTGSNALICPFFSGSESQKRKSMIKVKADQTSRQCPKKSWQCFHSNITNYIISVSNRATSHSFQYWSLSLIILQDFRRLCCAGQWSVLFFADIPYVQNK